MSIRLDLILIALGVAAHAAAARPNPSSHPQITEVLFNVPSDAAGDANMDGERHAAGDEFVEIANPHPAPINLRGYVLFNRRASFDGHEGSGVRFEFPDFELPAHGVCVVFNACDASIPGPLGTTRKPPESGNDSFNGAAVFSMENSSSGRALANGGDWIALASPDGTIIDCVSWGEPKPPPPTGALRSQKVDANPKGSVQRLTPTGELLPHRQVNGEPFSPGVIPTRTNALKNPKKSKK
ncbi:MAG: lamin tail domain-containing protein [Phycisphaerae bacterium]|nr:lamin tail domain-containing protein [Phycisphaerae bacterium]